MNPVFAPRRELFFWVAAVLCVVGVVGTVWAMYYAYISIPPHMPHDSFFIMKPENAAGNNPMKLYHSYRIFFLHLPSAYATMFVSLTMGLSGILYLISKKRHWDSLISAATQVGIATCLLTMATGFFWGDFAWGIGWSGEPRLNAVLVLWLSYLALLALRHSIPDPNKRAQLTAIYAILTLPIYPFAKYAIEIYGEVNHPPNLRAIIGDENIINARSLAIPSLISLYAFFVVLRFWHLEMRRDMSRIRRAMQELGNS